MRPDQIQRLFAYTEWANQQVLNCTARLTPQQYEQDFGVAWQSVKGTLTHLCDADIAWLGRIQGTNAQLANDAGAFETFADLTEAWRTVMHKRQAYLATCNQGDLDGPVRYSNSRGQAFEQPLWEVLLHIANHSTDHRSHVSIMLTELGCPPPPLDFIVWTRAQ